jgi:methanethiol oxidase
MPRVIGFVLLVFAAAASADETCNSPYIGIERLCDGSDKLVILDVNPKSKRYGKVIHTVSTGARVEAPF